MAQTKPEPATAETIRTHCQQLSTSLDEAVWNLDNMSAPDLIELELCRVTDDLRFVQRIQLQLMLPDLYLSLSREERRSHHQEATNILEEGRPFWFTVIPAYCAFHPSGEFLTLDGTVAKCQLSDATYFNDRNKLNKLAMRCEILRSNISTLLTEPLVRDSNRGRR